MDMLSKGFWPAMMLVASNVFMTFAWYGHLKYAEKGKWALWLVVLASWGIAFFEYVLMVPANRMGAENGLTTGQLKIMQELITLVVFAVFAATYLKETLSWRYYAAFALIIVAVILVFWDRK